MVFTEHVKVRPEKCGTIIFETLREKVFVTNPTGKDILHLLEKGLSIQQIIESLAQSYAVAPEDIRADVSNFINQLKDNQIIQTNESSRSS